MARSPINRRIIHTALMKSKNKADIEYGEICNFRLHPSKKLLLAEICEKNGANISLYLRECINALIKEYLSEAEYLALEAKCAEDKPKKR